MPAFFRTSGPGFDPPLNGSKQAAPLRKKRIPPETDMLFSKALRIEADNIPY